MARASWNGTISFGLVQIPVELYPAEETRELSFTLLDRNDLAPVGYQRINKNTGQIVPYDQIVKGYEHAKGEYVVLNSSDFVRANVEATQTIDIQEFVQLAEVPTTFFDRPYYVKPKKQGAKAFAVLRDALRKTGKAGIATLVLHTRQHLAALIADGDTVVLELLRFPDEIRSAQETVGTIDKTPPVTPLEQDMAAQLIDGMSASWAPEKYHDSYREDLLRLIDDKVKAGQVNTVTKDEGPPPAQSQREGVVDLVALLGQSLQARRQAQGAQPDAGARRPRAPAATREEKRRSYQGKAERPGNHRYKHTA
jgi:DNA end-binding protein Ku